MDILQSCDCVTLSSTSQALLHKHLFCTPSLFHQSLMRLWWVWLLILFIFMAFTCNSCKESFKNKQGLSKHQGVCAKVKKMKIEGSEQWQRKQQKTSSVEPENLGEEVEDLGHVRPFLLNNWTLNLHGMLGSQQSCFWFRCKWMWKAFYSLHIIWTDPVVPFSLQRLCSCTFSPNSSSSTITIASSNCLYWSISFSWGYYFQTWDYNHWNKFFWTLPSLYTSTHCQSWRKKQSLQCLRCSWYLLAAVPNSPKCLLIYLQELFLFFHQCNSLLPPQLVLQLEWKKISQESWWPCSKGITSRQFWSQGTQRLLCSLRTQTARWPYELAISSVCRRWMDWRISQNSSSMHSHQF